MSKIGFRKRINVGYKTYDLAKKYSEEFRTREQLNEYINYLFEDDINLNLLMSKIENNETFYILDAIRYTSFNVTKIDDLMYDINMVKFDDIRIPYIYGSKGIKITIKQGVKQYIPYIMGKKEGSWI